MLLFEKPLEKQEHDAFYRLQNVNDIHVRFTSIQPKTPLGPGPHALHGDPSTTAPQSSNT